MKSYLFPLITSPVCRWYGQLYFKFGTFDIETYHIGHIGIYDIETYHIDTFDMETYQAVQP